jgi:hypothetical protein
MRANPFAIDVHPLGVNARATTAFRLFSTALLKDWRKESLLRKSSRDEVPLLKPALNRPMHVFLTRGLCRDLDALLLLLSQV